MYEYGNNENQYPNSFIISGDSTHSTFDMNMEENNSNPTPPTGKKQHSLKKRFLLSACSGLLFGLCAGSVILIMSYFNPVNDTAGKSAKTAAEATSNSVVNKDIDGVQKVDTSSLSGSTITTDVSDVVKNAMPSVVSITGMYKVENEYGMYFGLPTEQEEEGSGSGIIIGKNDTELLVATNNHVVKDSTSLSVQFIDGESADAVVKGTDSSVDLAVIAIKLENISDSTMEEIKIASLGNSENISVGEPAIAIGNALGYGQSVTTGVISAVNREYTTEDNTKTYLIQTDAAINPGNSGGALLNINGEVIGINSNKIAGSVVEGMGYAIPISTAQPIIEKLMTKTTRERVDEAKKAYLGITGINVTEEVQEKYGLPEGVYVAQVFENTAAANAGIVKGDIIVSFDGESVSSMEELSELLACYTKGSTVQIEIMQGSPQGYQSNTLTITLGGKEPVS